MLTYGTINCSGGGSVVKWENIKYFPANLSQICSPKFKLPTMVEILYSQKRFYDVVTDVCNISSHK